MATIIEKKYFKKNLRKLEWMKVIRELGIEVAHK